MSLENPHKIEKKDGTLQEIAKKMLISLIWSFCVSTRLLESGVAGLPSWISLVFMVCVPYHSCFVERLGTSEKGVPVEVQRWGVRCFKL